MKMWHELIGSVSPEVVMIRITSLLDSIRRVCRDACSSDVDKYAKLVMKNAEKAIRTLATRFIASEDKVEEWRKCAHKLENERDELKEKLRKIERRMSEVTSSSKKKSRGQRTVGTETDESFYSLEGHGTSMVTPGVVRPIKPTPRKLRFSVSEEKAQRTKQKVAERRINDRDFPRLPRPGVSWSTVAKRGTENASMEDRRKSRGNERVKPPQVKRAPRITRGSTSVVTLTCGEADPSYAEALNEAKRRISLEELGISGTRMRRAFTGGLIIEVPGEEAASKADILARHLRRIFDKRVQRKDTATH